MSNNKALATKKETIDIVLNKVREFQNSGELIFPKNYIPENALKSAWLQIQETTDKEGRPALDVCTRNSVANALLKMVTLSLNPAKSQCYFIVYGNKLIAQRSYFGSMHVAKMVEPNISDIVAEVVYEGDIFEFEKVRGTTRITKHVQKLENIEKGIIKAAYATVIYKNGDEKSIIMTMKDIKKAWTMSKTKPIDDKGNIKAGSTHDKFTAEMCKKTVINRICKPIINSSDDSSIIAKFAKETDAELVEAEVEEEINENANQELIDIEDEVVEPEYTVDNEETATVEESEPKQPEKKPEKTKRSSKQQKNKEPNLVDMIEAEPQEDLPY